MVIFSPDVRGTIPTMGKRRKAPLGPAVALATLTVLAIAVLSVAIFQRLVVDGVLVISPKTVIEEVFQEEVVAIEAVLENVVMPVEAAPLVATGTVRYLKVADSCEFDYSDACLRVRSGPGKDHPTVAKLREGIVLRTDESVTVEGETWHKIMFDEWLRYPERATEEWYVSADYVEIFYDEGALDYLGGSATGTKHILVDRSEQILRAYDGEELFMEVEISTGLELTPTPRGTFHIFRKTPSRYMQGPLPYLVDQQYYDLPGVPWTLYFTEGGAAIHGTYWHNNFGNAQSHGCVNLRPEEAEKLYRWAELGTKVVVQD